MKEQKILSVRFDGFSLPTGKEELDYFEEIVSPSMLGDWKIKQISTTSFGEGGWVVYTLLLER